MPRCSTACWRCWPSIAAPIRDPLPLSQVAQNRWWDRIDRAARTLETGFIVAILGGLIILGAAQIVLRNFFSIGFAWGDGLTRLAVLWLGLLGALAASRDGRHITMGAVTRYLPRRLQLVAGVGADWFGAAVSGVLAWVSWSFVSDSREFGDTLLGDVPAWWLQAIMPVAFALMAWLFLVQSLRRSRRAAAVSEPPGTDPQP
jgi:TRAP-type C4-dicarboxylate transport system permease small subunit